MAIKYHETKLVSRDSIKPYSKNARVHTEEQVEQLVKSIKTYGFTNPILIDGKNVLIAGHGRLEAATELGIIEIPAVVIKGLSEDQKQALRIADNKLALNAYWDEELLRAEIAELQMADFDLELTGFKMDELDRLMTDPDDLDKKEFGGDPSDKWQLLIEYPSEAELQMAYDAALEDGLECKIIQ